MRRKKCDEDHPWHIHTGKWSTDDFFFGGFDYKIFGITFTQHTEAFEKAFNKYLLWKQLKR